MKRRAGFTIIEMMVVLFVVAVLITSIGQFTVAALQSLSLAEKRVAMNRVVPALQTAWQNALSDTDPSWWLVDRNILTTPDLQVTREGNELIFETKDRRQAYPLPAILTTSMGVESHASLPDCAVLNLYWESRWMTSVTTNRVRLVACGRKNDASR